MLIAKIILCIVEWAFVIWAICMLALPKKNIDLWSDDPDAIDCRMGFGKRKDDDSETD